MAATVKLTQKEKLRPQADTMSKTSSEHTTSGAGYKAKALAQIILQYRQQKKLRQKKQKVRNKHITRVGAINKFKSRSRHPMQATDSIVQHGQKGRQAEIEKDRQADSLKQVQQMHR